MTTVKPKPLNWRGPVSFSGSATTTATPWAVFAILADHEHWPEWFPVITKTEVLGPAREGVGMRRATSIPAGKVEERIIAWEPGKRFAFTATAVKPGIVRALVEVCRIGPVDSGTRRLTYTMYLDPVAPLRPIMKLMKGLMGKQLDGGMRALAARAEALNAGAPYAVLTLVSDSYSSSADAPPTTARTKNSKNKTKRT